MPIAVLGTTVWVLGIDDRNEGGSDEIGQEHGEGESERLPNSNNSSSKEGAPRVSSGETARQLL